MSPQIDGRETSYFKWLGAGIYSPDRTAKNGHAPLLQEIRYGFDQEFFYLRVDPCPDGWGALRDAEFRVTAHAAEDLRLMVALEDGRLAGSLLDTEEACILGPHELVRTAFDGLLEIAIGRRLFRLAGREFFRLDVAIWRNDFVLDALPIDGPMEIALGADAFAWPAE